MFSSTIDVRNLCLIYLCVRYLSSIQKKLNMINLKSKEMYCYDQSYVFLEQEYRDKLKFGHLQKTWDSKKKSQQA